MDDNGMDCGVDARVKGDTIGRWSRDCEMFSTINEKKLTFMSLYNIFLLQPVGMPLPMRLLPTRSYYVSQKLIPNHFYMEKRFTLIFRRRHNFLNSSNILLFGESCKVKTGLGVGRLGEMCFCVYMT